MIINTRLLLIMLLIAAVSFSSVNCSSDKTVAEIGSDKITLSSFEKEFLLSKGGDREAAAKSSLKEREAFLDNMINLRLKYKEGVDKKLDTTESYRTTLASAEKRLLAQEFVRNKIIDLNLEDYYNKTKYDLRVSHIFFPMEKSVQPEDSVKMYKLALQIVDKLDAGAGFDSLAKIYSIEEATKNKGGDLYYISPGMTVPEFEMAAFGLNPGEYTKIPVRSPMGLHIIKVTDKKDRMDSVRVSHILITDPVNEAGVKDSVKSYNEILSLKEKIKSKADFEEKAKQFSKDTISGKKGGDLGYVKRRQYANNFDSTIFSLEPGKISGIIRTGYGWHIIMMTEAVKIKPFQDIKEKIEAQYSGSQWFRKHYEKLVLELRSEYGVSVDNNGVDFILNKIKDTTLAFSVLNPDIIFKGDDKKVITGRYNGGELTLNDLISYVSMSSPAANTELTRFNLISLITASSDIITENLKAKELGYDKDERYKKSLEGIKKYVISDLFDKFIVMPSIIVSDSDIKAYFEKNKSSFEVFEKGIKKQKELDEVKNDISELLKKGALQGETKKFTDSLRNKYLVKTDYKALEKAFN